VGSGSWAALTAIWRTLDRHRALGVAAEMSFWIFCALIPLAVTALTVASQLPARSTAVLTSIFAEAPAATRALVAAEVARLGQNPVQPSLLEIGVFGWLASSGLHAIYDGFEAQLGVLSPWWKRRLRAILGCVLLSLGVALLALLGTGLGHLTGLAPQLFSGKMGTLLHSLLAMAVLSALVAGLYRLGIPRSARQKVRLWPGTIAVVLLSVVGGFGYRSYLATMGDGSAYYAGLAVVIITLTALYLFSLAMLLGLAMNQQLARRPHIDRPGLHLRRC
jgi:membrane protein